MVDAESTNGVLSSPAPTKRERPTHTLPTDRITFTKQMDILRACTAINVNSGRVVSNAEIGEIVGMKASTVSLANPFLASSNLLQKAKGGHFPSAEALSFHRAWEWTPETATQKLAPAIRETWFAKALLPKLSFGSISEDVAVAKLADQRHESCT
jgi:hypothetical protein